MIWTGTHIQIKSRKETIYTYKSIRNAYKISNNVNNLQTVK